LFLRLTEGVFPAGWQVYAATQAGDRAIPRRWEQEVFSLLLREGKITENVVANIRSRKCSGFSVDQSAGLEAVENDR